MQLIVTRPIVQALAAVQELRSLGVPAVALPLIGIEPLSGTPADAEARATLNRCWTTLGERRLVMFVSANAVTQFFAAAPAHTPWPAQTLAGSTGPGTTAALRAVGVPAHNVQEPPRGAERLDSEALWQTLRQHPWQGASVLIVRGEGGRDWLADTLRKAGARVDQVAAYRRTLPALSIEQAALLVAADADPAGFAWHFSSSEAVHNLPRLTAATGWRASRAFATHGRIGEAARAIGFADVQTLAPGVNALVQAWAALQTDGASAGAGGARPDATPDLTPDMTPDGTPDATSAATEGRPGERRSIQSRPL